ncbi:MAG: BMP family ABC transporter substrate-binding protein [Clostridia bacterium]|nr:BMP family ABC transporter substrate-binding protein [Clostridia bacterium]
MEYCIHCMAPLNGSAKFCPACGKPQAYECPENHLRPGTLLGGRYLVGAAIGAGGFGITYIARDTRLGNVVAVKEYYPNGLVNRSTTLTTNVSVGSQQRGTFEKGKQKFLAEAQLLATLNDEPGVVDVRDFFEENNTAYIVMEYLRGETLKDHLKTVQRIEYSEAFRLLLPVMRSLRAVHAMGLIHRDISPDNIMLAQNGVKLLDFGAAREVIDEDKSLSIILKRGFAPVEQYTKRNQGPWTDVYALCATMYKCITGAVPTDALLRREEPLKAPSSFGVPMTPAFESVLLRGLAVDAKDRYQSMDTLIGAFETALRYPNQAVMGVTERLTPAPDDAVTQGRSVPGNPVAPPTVAAAPQTQTTPLQPVALWQPPVTPGRPDAVTVASPQSGAQPAVPTKKKNKALAPILVGVVLLVAAVAAICMWYFGGKGKDDDTDVSTDAVQVAEDSGWSDVSDSVTVPDGLGRLDTPQTKYAYSTDSQLQPYVQLRSGPSKDAEVVLQIPNQYLDDSELDKAKLTVYSEPVHDDAQDIDRVLCRYTYGGKDVWGWARTDFLHESKDAAEAALEAANTSKDTTVEATTPTPVNTSFKVGFIFLHDENSTYDKNFIDAAIAACDELGVEYILKTNIPEDNTCYETAADLADSGCGFIFADSFGHESYMIKAAQEFPDVQFAHATGTRAHTEGLSNYHNAYAAIYEGRYLTGVAAGMKLNEMIEAGKIAAEEAKIGFVGAFTYSEVLSSYTAFFLGARSVCPSVTMEVYFTGSWYDEAQEKEAATQLINNGCMLISQYADSYGAPTACENAGIPNVSYNGSTMPLCPNTYLIGTKIDWTPYLKYAITQAATGGAIDMDWTGTIETGSVVITELNDAVATPGTAEKIEEVKACLRDGSVRVFDMDTFTVNGKELTSYIADIDTDAAYKADTEVVSDGYFHESEYRSAPYFDLRIDGITLLNEEFY